MCYQNPTVNLKVEDSIKKNEIFYFDHKDAVWNICGMNFSWVCIKQKSISKNGLKSSLNIYALIFIFVNFDLGFFEVVIS